MELNTVTLKFKLSPKMVHGDVAIPARIQGKEGPPGPSGVWTGSDTPPDGYDVWIDPNGDTDTIVNSVNSKTGHAVLTADDVGAMDVANVLTNSDILAIWNSF